MYEHEIPLANLVISILVLQYTSINSILKPFDILMSKEKSVFLVSLVIGGIIATIFLIKHL